MTAAEVAARLTGPYRRRDNGSWDGRLDVVRLKSLRLVLIPETALARFAGTSRTGHPESR